MKAILFLILVQIVGAAHAATPTTLKYYTACKLSKPSADLKRSLLLIKKVTAETNCLKSSRKLYELKSLDLKASAFTSLELLSGLDHLETLDLSSTGPYVSLIPLTTLKGLKTLSLQNTQIRDLTEIGKVSTLQHLNLNQNLIEDYRELENLKDLRTLSLALSSFAKNRLEDASSFIALENLTDLNLEGHNISEVGPLFQMRRLKLLNLNNNPLVSDLIMPHAENLKTLFLEGTSVASLRIENNSTLLNLNVGSPKLKELIFINSSKILKELSVSNSELRIIQTNQVFENLEVIKLFNNPLQNIFFLNGTTRLKNASLIKNQIPNISQLGLNKNLEHLDVSQNKITDLRVILSFPILSSLNVSGNPIQRNERQCPTSLEVAPLLRNFCRDYLSASSSGVSFH